MCACPTPLVDGGIVPDGGIGRCARFLPPPGGATTTSPSPSRATPRSLASPTEAGALRSAGSARRLHRPGPRLGEGPDKLAVDRTAIEHYVRLLDALILVERSPAWGKTLLARGSAAPKFHFLDSGLAARLLAVYRGEPRGLGPHHSVGDHAPAVDLGRRRTAQAGLPERREGDERPLAHQRRGQDRLRYRTRRRPSAGLRGEVERTSQG